MSTPRDYTTGQVLTATMVDDLAQGVLAFAQITANAGPTSGTTALDVVTAAAITPAAANRRLRITAHIRSVTGTVASDTFELRIREGSTQLNAISFQIINTAVPQWSGDLSHIVEGPTVASHTYKLSLVRTSGTGTATLEAAATYPCQITVEDCGTTV